MYGYRSRETGVDKDQAFAVTGPVLTKVQCAALLEAMERGGTVADVLADPTRLTRAMVAIGEVSSEGFVGSPSMEPGAEASAWVTSGSVGDPIVPRGADVTVRTVPSVPSIL